MSTLSKVQKYLIYGFVFIVGSAGIAYGTNSITLLTQTFQSGDIATTEWHNAVNSKLSSASAAGGTSACQYISSCGNLPIMSPASYENYYSTLVVSRVNSSKQGVFNDIQINYIDGTNWALNSQNWIIPNGQITSVNGSREITWIQSAGTILIDCDTAFANNIIMLCKK